jgi:hypothetical protein
MNFNNACFFTALANLLQDFDVDVEDIDIIKNSIIRYVFDYHEETKHYIAGYQIQSEEIINQYLNSFHLKFMQKKYTSKSQILNKKSMVNDLKSRKNVIVSLKVHEKSDLWHAMILKDYKNQTFHFINMKHLCSPEPDTYLLDEQETIHLLADNTQFGWIERTTEKTNLNIENIKKQSLINIEKLKNELILNIHQKLTLEQRLKDRERLFRPLLLSYLDVLNIVGEKDLKDKGNKILKEYVQTFNKNKEITLSSYINERSILSLIDGISDIIRRKSNEPKQKPYK